MNQEEEENVQLEQISRAQKRKVVYRNLMRFGWIDLHNNFES